MSRRRTLLYPIHSSKDHKGPQVRRLLRRAPDVFKELCGPGPNTEEFLCSFRTQVERSGHTFGTTNADLYLPMYSYTCYIHKGYVQKKISMYTILHL